MKDLIALGGILALVLVMSEALPDVAVGQLALILALPAIGAVRISMGL